MGVNIQVHESIVAQVKPRLPVRIRVHPFADEVLTGFVESINPLPEHVNTGPVYTTRVSIAKNLRGLRPGMTADVEIFTELDNVLSVPLAAVVRSGMGEPVHVFVKKADGGLEGRNVILGLAGDDGVEVKEGIQSGELVVLDPVAAMNKQKKSVLTPPAATPSSPR